MDDPYEGRKNYIKDTSVYIFSEFNEKISDLLPDFYSLILKVKDLKDPSIEIIINSPGGYSSELFGLLSYIDLAKSLGIKIITRVIGEAYSCGSYLAVVGDERCMSKYAFQLMHYGTGASSPVHNAVEIDRLTDYNKKHFENLVDIYAKHTKLDKRKIRALMRDNLLYLDAETCLKYGFCDYIF